MDTPSWERRRLAGIYVLARFAHVPARRRRSQGRPQPIRRIAPNQNENCWAMAIAPARRLVEGYVRGMSMADPDTDADFDTLAYARRLREAGVEAKQAEAHAEAARTVRAGLATKADLDAGLNNLEMRFDARIAALRADIYRALWVQTGAFAAIMTAIIAAFKLFG